MCPGCQRGFQTGEKVTILTRGAGGIWHTDCLRAREAAVRATAATTEKPRG